MTEQPRALGKPYDDSADQALPGMPEPPPPTLAERLAAIVDAPPPPQHAGSFYGIGPDGLPEAGPEIELPPPAQPVAVARKLVALGEAAGLAPFRFWRGDLYRHQVTHWASADPSEINQWLYLTTERAWYSTLNKKGSYDVRGWHPDRKKIGAVLHALSDGLLTYNGEEDRCMALENGVLDPATKTLKEHTRSRFNLNVIPFRYTPEATCPQWLAFLESVLPGDQEAQDFLGEWFGYVLSGRTDQHKMASLVGPPRCGKGTIARTLEALMGEAACAAPTIGGLGGTFGREPLIGKALAVMGDVRWHAAAVAEAVPHLLMITGGDSVDVERKNRKAWHGKLGVRFMAMSNDVPVFRDASMALAGRMIHIQFHQSFRGREDMRLGGRLATELPGILNWALAGLDRLNARGYFHPPASSEQLDQEVRRQASPYQAFLEDCCEVKAGVETDMSTLLAAYNRWAASEGRTLDRQTASALSRGLRSADSRITTDGKRRRNTAGVQSRWLDGVRLASQPDAPKDTWLIGDDRDSRYEADTLV
jgi:putative DNA primase/helicase